MKTQESVPEFLEHYRRFRFVLRHEDVGTDAFRDDYVYLLRASYAKLVDACEKARDDDSCSSKRWHMLCDALTEAGRIEVNP